MKFVEKRKSQIILAKILLPDQFGIFSFLQFSSRDLHFIYLFYFISYLLICQCDVYMDKEVYDTHDMM